MLPREYTSAFRAVIQDASVNKLVQPTQPKRATVRVALTTNDTAYLFGLRFIGIFFGGAILSRVASDQKGTGFRAGVRNESSAIEIIELVNAIDIDILTWRNIRVRNGRFPFSINIVHRGQTNRRLCRCRCRVQGIACEDEGKGNKSSES
jgi:hypothetical protein